MADLTTLWGDLMFTYHSFCMIPQLLSYSYHIALALTTISLTPQSVILFNTDVITKNYSGLGT